MFFKNCQISRFESKIFELFRKLRTLDISSIELEYLRNDLFFNADKLVKLIASNNLLTEIQSIQFNAQLEYADFSFNKINRIAENAFMKAASLKKLNLSHNAMTALKSNTLNFLPKLIELDLSHNKIEETGDAMLSRLVNLEYLDLSHNFVKQINIDVFMGAHALKELNCSHNNINIRTDTFDHLPNLELLDLSFNAIKEIHVATFVKLGKLKTLNLSHNNLTNLVLGTFSNKMHFQSLDLSDNFLDKFDFGLFLPRTSLQSFLINENRLHELNGFKNSLLPNLRSFGISGNHFNCSYLRNFLYTFHWNDEHHFIELVNDGHFSNYHGPNLNSVPCNITSEENQAESLQNMENAVTTIQNNQFHQDQSVHYTIKNLLIVLCVLIGIGILAQAVMFIWKNRSMGNISKNYNCSYNRGNGVHSSGHSEVDPVLITM